MKEFKDFASDENLMDGKKIPIENIINQKVSVLGFRINKSKYNKGNGKCLTIQIENEGKRKVIFTGSEVLMNQCEKYKDEMPFIAMIKKIDKYYSFA